MIDVFEHQGREFAAKDIVREAYDLISNYDVNISWDKAYIFCKMAEYHPENNDLLKEYKTTDDGNVLNLKSGKIVIGAINSCSGNVLFNGILDNHPDILIMSDTFLSRNLYSICERLAWEPSDLV